MPRKKSGFSNVVAQAQAAISSTVQRLKMELRNLDGQRAELVDYLRRLGHGSNGSAVRTMKAPAPSKRGKGKRIRRTPDQLATEANAIYDMVQQRKSVSGPEIRAKFPKVGPDIKGYVKQYSGKSLKSKGTRRAMRYVAG